MAESNSKTDRLSDLLRESKIDHVLLTSLASLRYFAGHTTGIETGASPFSPLPGALAWVKGEEPILFLADSEPGGDVESGIACRSFPGYTYENPLRGLDQLTNLMVGKFTGLPSSTIAVEMGDLPAFILEKLSSNSPALKFQDITTGLAEMRSIKVVNSISPGFIRTAISIVDGVNEKTTEQFVSSYLKTGRIPLRRAGLAGEVAAAALFLAARECGYMTGADLVVDGGLTITL